MLKRFKEIIFMAVVLKGSGKIITYSVKGLHGKSLMTG